MTSFDKNIRFCSEILLKADFLAQAGVQESLKPSKDFKISSMKEVHYEKIYEIGIKKQDFNILLADYSFFQFSKNNSLGSLRLAYYPNPKKFLMFDGKVYDFLELCEKYSFEEAQQIIDESEPLNEIPPIRYDFDTFSHCENHHPAAHLHIGSRVENRWPVEKILSPSVFLLKILFLYYRDFWLDNFEHKILDSKCLDELYIQEISKCSSVPNEYFSKKEKVRLYLS